MYYKDYDYDYDNCYEQSKADEVYEETLEKLKELLREDIKNEIEYIRKENLRLKKENEELKDKTRNIDNREQTLNMKEKDLENKSERYFYSKKFSEILKPLEESMKIWYVSFYWEYIPKCENCDENRKVDYISPFGTSIKGKCECNKTEKTYKIVETNIQYLSFYKSNRNQEFILTPKYDSGEYDSTYFKLDFQYISKKFEEDKVLDYKISDGYRDFTAFNDREECEKYYNWLMKNKNK